MNMELMTLTASSNYPTQQAEIDTLVSNLKFTILPNGQAVVDFIELNYDTIIDSIDIMAKSKETYRKNGREFLRFIQLNGLNIDTFINFKSYLLSKTDKSPIWQSSKLIVAKAILKNLHGHRRILTIDLTASIKSIKSESQHKDGLNENDIAQVKDHIQSITDPNKRIRLNAMFALLAYQGLRQFEVCNIKVEDISFKSSKLKVLGKGYKLDNVILHPYTVTALTEYLQTSGKKSGYLFTSEKGTTTGERLTERGIRKVFEAIFDKLDIERSVHGFRHFFTTKLCIKTNGNLNVVKEYTRHSSIHTVTKYWDNVKKQEHDEMFFKAFD